MRRTLPVLLALALLSAACQVRFDTTITVNDDESGTFGIEIGLDEEFRQLAAEQGGGQLDLMEGAEVPPGWIVEEFVDGEFEGSRIAVEFSDFADLEAKLVGLSESSATGGGAPNDLVESLDLTRNGNRFDFRADLTGMDESFSDMAGGDAAFEGLDPAQFLESLFQVRFLVTLPGTIGDHNADLVEGNTLVWRVPLDAQDRTLRASSSLTGSGLAEMLPLILAAAVVLLVAGAGFIIYRRRAGAASFPAPVLAASRDTQPVDPGPVEGDPFAG